MVTFTRQGRHVRGGVHICASVMRPVEFTLSFSLPVGSFRRSESVYTPSISSAASTAAGPGDSEVNETHPLPRRNLRPNVGERPMCKELQLRGEHPVEICARERSRGSVW